MNPRNSITNTIGLQRYLWIQMGSFSLSIQIELKITAISWAILRVAAIDKSSMDRSHLNPDKFVRIRNF
jgi:hypothetical protein